MTNEEIIEDLKAFFAGVDPAILSKPIKFNSASWQNNPAQFLDDSFGLLAEGLAPRTENMYINLLKELRLAIEAL